jgi:ABC-2 type transport system ATP-binding protein
MSSSDSKVRLDNVDKLFYNHHFWKRDESTGQRPFYHKKSVHAVDHVSFEIPPGEIFGLLGPNGAGKTTLVKMISGLVRPDSGGVYVDGMNVERKRLQVLRRVGVVLEGTRTSIWPLTPLENLAYYGNLKDMKGRLLKQRSRELLEFIGLKDQMNVQVRRLSRGQKQKVAICIALIADPPVILLDEPTTGLDVQSSRSIKEKIIQMTREQGKSVLVTTHDMNVAQELCDRIGIINHGKLITCRPTGELLRHFSDFAVEFKLDRQPDAAALWDVPGVKAVEAGVNGDGQICTMRFEGSAEQRSEAIYEALARMRAQGLVLLGVSQRQERLEDVFVRLTSEASARPESAPAGR